jgi:hypothetical protein
MTSDEAGAIALQQAELDNPEFNVRCRVLAEEDSRFVVVASMYRRTGPTVRPNPMALYAVVKSDASVTAVGPEAGLPHGLNLRQRR